jgi:hypothetical protein
LVRKARVHVQQGFSCKQALSVLSAIAASCWVSLGLGWKKARRSCGQASAGIVPVAAPPLASSVVVMLFSSAVVLLASRAGGLLKIRPDHLAGGIGMAWAVVLEAA